MEPPSSTSSSERSIDFWPRVPRAGWLAVAVAIAVGAVLRSIAVPAPGTPPVAAFAQLDAEAYRYAATTGRGRSEILLVGSSLMRYAVREEQLAEELGDPDLLVFNAGLDGGRLWDVLRLVDSIPPSKAPGRKLAILEVNRVAAETSILDHPYAEARRRRDGKGLADALWAEVPPRQDAVTWAQQAIYGKIARALPGLVPVPRPIPRMIWGLNEAQRTRAVRGKEPAVMGAGLHHTVWETPEVMKLLVAALHDHGFRVLVLQTPLHGEMYAAMPPGPSFAEVDRAYRKLVLDPSSTGADGALVLDRTSDIGGDDTMLADYGHLLPAGASALTHRLAEHLRTSPLWGGR